MMVFCALSAAHAREISMNYDAADTMFFTLSMDSAPMISVGGIHQLHLFGIGAYYSFEVGYPLFIWDATHWDGGISLTVPFAVAERMSVPVRAGLNILTGQDALDTYFAVTPKISLSAVPQLSFERGMLGIDAGMTYTLPSYFSVTDPQISDGWYDVTSLSFQLGLQAARNFGEKSVGAFRLGYTFYAGGNPVAGMMPPLYLNLSFGYRFSE